MSSRCLLVLTGFVLLGSPFAVGQSSSVSGYGWKVSVEPGTATLKIEHERLGAIADHVVLGLRQPGGVAAVKAVLIARPGPNQLSFRSENPPSAWLFQLGDGRLSISCTSSAAVLVGQVPAGKGRMPVRVLDPAGTPVKWVGTDEVVTSYGGREAINPSFLPVRNPECMYFSLGPTENLSFDDLFDRATDTAVDFPPRSTLTRNRENQDLIDISIPVAGNATIRLLPDYFKRTLGVPFYIPYDDSRLKTAPTVWCSWTAYYADIREEDIVANTDWLAANLKDYGFQYVQLDDGYDRAPNGEHYWIENWDKSKFPHGPEWLTGYIKSKGLHPGLWLVPNAWAGAVDTHPEWYLHFKNGEMVRDYRTPALDSSNPEVLAFLKNLFGTLRGWGFEYYKFDGEHAIPKYAPNVDLSRLYDDATDPLEVYRKRLAVIREAVGPDTFIEGCQAGTPLNGVGFFNSSFTGHDVYNSWQGMYPLFSSINANAFLNHMVIYVMPGEGIDVGPQMTVEEARTRRVPRFVAVAESREKPLVGFGTTLDEARTVATFVSLSGVVYPVASVLPELPAERVQILKATIPTLPIFPADLFSRGTDMAWSKFKTTQPDYYLHNYPEILDLKVNAESGRYDVAAFTNWSGVAVTREVSLTDKLGLEEGPLVAFDFWRRTLVPVESYRGVAQKVTLEIRPHETRVLLVHPASAGLQYLGTSRHISGAYSILRLAQDNEAGTVSGSSQTIAGEPYTLWFRVDRAPQIQVEAGGKPLKFDQKLDGHLLTLTFQGQPEVVKWNVKQ